MTEKAHEFGIDVTFKIGGGGFLVTSGVVFVNGQHYRGMQRGTTLTFHSGWNPATRSYQVKPFKSVEAFARMLWHETLHFYFYVGNRHSSDHKCMMHPLNSNWPCPGEVALMKQHWGTYKPPVPPQPEPDDTEKQIRKLRAERQQLWYERKRINDRIKEIDNELEHLEGLMSSESRLAVAMESIASTGDVYCGAMSL